MCQLCEPLIGPLVRLNDGGPVYAETDLSRYLVEPWNAFSSLSFVLVALLILYKIRGHYSENKFLLFAVMLLCLGGLGSTFYHAFRSSRWLLIMDVAPIGVLTLAVAVYFWLKILPRWWYLLFVFAPMALVRWLAFGKLSVQNAINLNYFITGVLIFVPVLLFLYHTRWRQSLWILASIVLLVSALVCRKLDDYPIAYMPMGTHWLWHVFSALGAGAMGYYLSGAGKGKLVRQGRM